MSFDDAVETAWKASDANGWAFTQDMTLKGYTKIPGQILCGYSTLVREIWEDLSLDEAPTHIFLQVCQMQFFHFFWSDKGRESPSRIWGCLCTRGISSTSWRQSFSPDCPCGCLDPLPIQNCSFNLSSIYLQYIQTQWKYLLSRTPFPIE